MKGKLSVWYLILIVISVLTLLTIMYTVDSIVQDLFIDALDSATD